MGITGTRPKVPFLDLGRQQAAIATELERAIADVVRSGRYVLDDQVRLFEAEFAAWCGVGFGVGVASGTDALQLALSALEVGPGHEVITVANAGSPTICAIEAAGATPVLADVDPVTLTIDPAGVEARITDRTRAIVPVHLYGQCADVDALLALGQRRDLRIVEDCAQAHGARVGDRAAGSMGDAGCFSFYPTKNLGALGDGGIVVTADPAVAQAVRELRTYGQRERRDSVRKGRNSRLDELQAAILRVKLPRVDAWNARRREVAAAYAEGLAGLPLALPAQAPGRTHVYHLYVVRSPERDSLRSRLHARGIETLVHYERPVHLQTSWPELAAQSRWLGETERAAREVLSLPLYPEMTDAEVALVIDAVRKVA